MTNPSGESTGGRPEFANESDSKVSGLPAQVSPLLAEPRNSVDRFANRIADFCSPIVLKQIRQNVKSRVFVATFHLLLFATVFWTVTCYIYSTAGNTGVSSYALLAGYFLIFGFPLAVIIPAMAFEGISSSYRDNTQDLLSITTTGSRELAYGVFFSNFLQALIYLGGVFPCIVFCLLLAGTDIHNLIFMASAAFVGTFLLIALAMMLASIATGAVSSLICRLGLILFSFYCYALWCVLVFSLVYDGSGSHWSYLPTFFWVFVLSGVLTVLFIESSVSLSGFVSENKSTVLRLLVFAPPFAVVAMFFDLILRGSRISFTTKDLTIFSVLAQVIGTHYWLVIGSIVCAERQDMSKRVQRSLPLSPLYKRFLSLLYPGFGRGYLYSLAMIISWNVSFTALPAISSTVGYLCSFSQLELGVLFIQQWYLLYCAVINISFGGIFLAIIFLLNRIIFITKGNGRILNSLFLLALIYIGYHVAIGILFGILDINSGVRTENYVPFFWWGAVFSFENGYFGRAAEFHLWTSCYLSGVFYGILFLVLTKYCVKIALGELLLTNPNDTASKEPQNPSDSKSAVAPGSTL